MTVERFIVSLDVPSGVSVERMGTYIWEEIKANVGRLDPADPLFHLDQDSVGVAHVRKRKEPQ